MESLHDFTATGEAIKVLNSIGVDAGMDNSDSLRINSSVLLKKFFLCQGGDGNKFLASLVFNQTCTPTFAWPLTLMLLKVHVPPPEQSCAANE